MKVIEQLLIRLGAREEMDYGTSTWYLIYQHFQPLDLSGLSVRRRSYPARIRVDVCHAFQVLAERNDGIRIVGVEKAHEHRGLTFIKLLEDEHYPAVVAMPQYEDVDVGESEPKSCLVNGLCLGHAGGVPFVMFLGREEDFCGHSGNMGIDVVVPDDEPGRELAGNVLSELDELVKRVPSYRGKILSLEQSEGYGFGTSIGIRVHHLGDVAREQLVLPESTVTLLERNTFGFVERRAELVKHGQSPRKGLLFYGPPGTGKTHSIHYLAKALPGHTTLIITAEQMDILADYMALARLMQPSLVVIEDVDLIARSRRNDQPQWKESTLNKLLNEMDGLRDDAEIMFILTTNRPESLEAALADRPGRIDQAIEFPLPDAAGRDQLLDLYGSDLSLTSEVRQQLVSRTEGCCASFIKELMRRCLQYHLEHAAGNEITAADVDHAVSEMLMNGALNKSLLGGPIGFNG